MINPEKRRQGGGQNLERRNVERPIFWSFKIANIKITKDEIFDNFIFEFNFSFFRNHLNFFHENFFRKFFFMKFLLWKIFSNKFFYENFYRTIFFMKIFFEQFFLWKFFSKNLFYENFFCPMKFFFVNVFVFLRKIFYIEFFGRKFFFSQKYFFCIWRLWNNVLCEIFYSKFCLLRIFLFCNFGVRKKKL